MQIVLYFDKGVIVLVDLAALQECVGSIGLLYWFNIMTLSWNADKEFPDHWKNYDAVCWQVDSTQNHFYYLLSIIANITWPHSECSCFSVCVFHASCSLTDTAGIKVSQLKNK